MYSSRRKKRLNKLLWDRLIYVVLDINMESIYIINKIIETNLSPCNLLNYEGTIVERYRVIQQSERSNTTWAFPNWWLSKLRWFSFGEVVLETLFTSLWVKTAEFVSLYFTIYAHICTCTSMSTIYRMSWEKQILHIINYEGGGASAKP